MSIEAWWPLLRAGTRQWLIANNGDSIPSSIVEEIAALGGPAADDAWWVASEDSTGYCMPDHAVDWIEEAANDEVDSASGA